MAKLKFSLDKRNKKRGEASPLIPVLRHNNTSAFQHRITLLPSQWDERLEKVIVHPGRSAYNAHLEQMKLDMQERLLELRRGGNPGGMSDTSPSQNTPAISISGIYAPFSTI